MRVTVCYMAQVRQAAGTPSESVELDRPCSAGELVVKLAGQRGDALQRLLLDEGGRLQRTILLFVGDDQVDPASPAPLRAGDVVSVLSPIAGGQGCGRLS